MPELHVLEVFIAPNGAGGNPLGVFLDGAEVPESERQCVATALGFSETVFVGDAERAELRIFTPVSELPFAGPPVGGDGVAAAPRARARRGPAPAGR